MVLRGWYTFPVCRKKLQKVLPTTVMFDVPVYCRKCRAERFPTIYEGRELDDDEPFPLKTE